MLSVPLSPKVNDAQTKVKLKIPKLALGDLEQMDRHLDENVAGSNPTGGKQFAQINLPFTMK